jgi:hypothetical protein
MQTCKYCGRLKTLVKSHIIPRSFCEIKAFQQNASYNALSLSPDSEDVKPLKRSIGVYDDELFCKACEDKFMIYDAYAFTILNEQGNRRKTLRDEQGQVLGAYYETYDYNKLKLFFISVLLRAGLSNVFFFKHIKVEPYLELLKEAIDAGQAPDANDFAVFLAYYDEIKRGPILFPPAQKRIQKIKFFYFHIGQVIFYIKIDKRATPQELQPIILQPSGKLVLMTLSHKDPANFDILKGIERIRHGIE